MALDGRVLLLNQTYEPLGTVSVARAVIMTFKDTVTVEEFDSERVLRSARAEFRVPSVIRRRTYINVRRRREASGMKRLRIYMRDKFRCQYCGEKKTLKQLNYDHVIPRVQGGKTVWENIVTSCYPCNDRKGSRTPQQAGMKLLRQPHKPASLPVVPPIRLEEGQLPETWQPYCDGFLSQEPLSA